jgi:Spy/CpxP family protein refolding chaperone
MKPRTIGSRLLIVAAATALTITMAGSAAAKHSGEGGHGGGWGWHGGEGWHGGGGWHGGCKPRRRATVLALELPRHFSGSVLFR